MHISKLSSGEALVGKLNLRPVWTAREFGDSLTYMVRPNLSKLGKKKAMCVR